MGERRKEEPRCISLSFGEQEIEDGFNYFGRIGKRCSRIIITDITQANPNPCLAAKTE